MNRETLNFQNVDLENENFENRNLAGALFFNLDLQNKNFTGSNLTGANFTGADLTGANFTNAILTDSYLTDADLTGANFTRANLTGADLTVASCQNTNFTNAILEQANFTGANYDEANFTNTQGNMIDNNEENINLEQRVALEPQGIAYEIHNAFASFKPKEEEYLALINQRIFTGDIHNFIKKTFEINIDFVFPKPINITKKQQFNTVFNKSSSKLREIDESYKQLIAKSVKFAFDQNKDFKQEYIITFLDETCNAYSGDGDNTSCVNGILERYILSIGKVVQILCIDGCENETYKKLDKLMNSKFLIADVASEWWENESIKPDVGVDAEERRANFIKYLTDKAKQLNLYNEQIKKDIEDYTKTIDYAFADLSLGGKKQMKIKRRRSNKKKLHKSKRGGNGGLYKSKKSRKSKKTNKSNKTKKSNK